MTYLIIDSTDGINLGVTSLHVRNSMILSEYLNCPLIGSKEVPEGLCKKYDVIIFVHASGYTNVDAFRELMTMNKNSKFYYVKNDYTLGEPVILWEHCKCLGIKFTPIANHPREVNIKCFDKYTTGEWFTINLNALIYGQFFKPSNEINSLSDFFDVPKKRDIVYYGTCRSDRIKYFEKYFDESFVVSTSKRNLPIFLAKSPTVNYINRLNWSGDINTLNDFRSTLYIEDEFTNNNYSCLANRFYESLNFNVPCFFDRSCENTIKLSGYPINPWYIVDSREELKEKLKIETWPDYGFDTLHKMAMEEKHKVLSSFKEIVSR